MNPILREFENFFAFEASLFELIKNSARPGGNKSLSVCLLLMVAAADE